MVDRYAVFERNGMRLWLEKDTSEIFVKGKGWITYAELAVGDQVCHGKIAFIGTEAETNHFANHRYDALG